MKKQRNLLVFSLIALSLVGVALTALYVLDIFNLLYFGILIFLDLVLIIANIVLLVRILKKIKKKREVKKEVENKTTGNYLEDLYGAIGIPLQYNKDGSIKDVYDLLGIEPVYDENGNRTLTVYEFLGIMPRFTKEGKEIPTVFAIKNGAGRIARVDLTHRVLKRKLSEKEKEQILIREALKKKLDEAKLQGDKKKEEAIQKAIVAVTVVPKKVEEKKPNRKKASPKFISANVKSTIGIAKQNKQHAGFLNGIFDIIAKPNASKKEEPKSQSQPKLNKSQVVRKIEKEPEPSREPVRTFTMIDMGIPLGKKTTNPVAPQKEEQLGE